MRLKGLFHICRIPHRVPFLFPPSSSLVQWAVATLLQFRLWTHLRLLPSPFLLAKVAKLGSFRVISPGLYTAPPFSSRGTFFGGVPPPRLPPSLVQGEG